MMEKRKNIRISHEHHVKCSVGDQTFTGKAIDISNKGMQVIVTIPETHQDVRSITFTLPQLRDQLDIPCKVIRIKKCSNGEAEQVLGIEFQYKAEAQLSLIDNFIRAMKKKELLGQTESAEMRQVPRAMCHIDGVSCNKHSGSIISIDDISTDGFLMSYEGTLETGDLLNFEFFLPGDERMLAISGSIMYVVENVFKEISVAGVVFSDIGEIDRVRIRNFIVNSSSGAVLMSLQERLSEKDIDQEYRITCKKRIQHIFHQLKSESVRLNVLFEGSYKIVELQINDVMFEQQHFVTTLNDEIMDIVINRPHPVYCYFFLHGGSHYFISEFGELHGDRMLFTMPSVVYQLEKRSYGRKFMGDDIELCTEYSEGYSDSIQGKLIDISRRGFLCEVPLTNAFTNTFKLGQTLAYVVNLDLGLSSYGEIRHIKERVTHEKKTVLQIGIEAGIKRKKYVYKKYSHAEWKREELYKRKPHPAAQKKIISSLVTYRNKEGKQISALVNCTRKNTSAPVVILPPAFGKKKETLSPLVTTLIANFRKFNKHIVTLRYDGINRPGESFNDEMCPRRGYEMLHYKLSQGYDDLSTTLDYVYNNSLFSPTQVIIVAFSMSAMDARKLLINPDNKKVDMFINVMGAPCAQSTLSNVMGGMDIVGNVKMGVPNGVSGMLGHIVDLDNIGSDLIDKKYAYITDARIDMSKITIPVHWIYGEYDKWVNADEVRDIMSVASQGKRELINIPTGHNIRSSEDAVKTFKIITSIIYKHLYKKDITPIDPDRKNMVSLITYERERIAEGEDLNIDSYWKDYLIGTGGSSMGYDFYRNIKEFRDFLAEESRMIELQDGEVLGDMGCGTGLFIESLLQFAVHKNKTVVNARVIMVDLVQEALDKAKIKYDRMLNNNPDILPCRAEYVQMNLDPNRLIPVKQFIEHPKYDFNFLRNRIEGLKNRTVDSLLKNSSRRLYELIRGEAITNADALKLKSRFSDEECAVIEDLNRASRFLNNALMQNDFIKDKQDQFDINNDDQYMSIKTCDLHFSRLKFSDNGVSMHTGFDRAYFDKIVASLFISYLYNPDDIIHEFYRMLKPGGKLLVSTMKPDSDMSLIFTSYVDKVQHFDHEDTDITDRELNLSAARNMLNEAAMLFELEEDGYFQFYTENELVSILEKAGFKNIQAKASLGNPPQAVIVTGIK